MKRIASAKFDRVGRVARLGLWWVPAPGIVTMPPERAEDAGDDPSRAASLEMESALFLLVDAFLTMNRIHFT